MTVDFMFIEYGIRPVYDFLDKTGIPIYGPSFWALLHERTCDLAKLKESVNKQVGFIPNFFSTKDWQRIILTMGGTLPTQYGGSALTNATVVNELKNEFPILLELQRGRNLTRLLTDLNHLESSLVNQNDWDYLFSPSYFSDDKYGRIKCNNLFKLFLGGDNEIRKCVGKWGYKIIEGRYNNLELATVQKLSNDPVLLDDLVAGDFYKNLCQRLFSGLSDHDDFITIAKAITNVTISGGGPQAISQILKTEGQDISESDIRPLYNKWIAIYSTCFEYLQELKKSDTFINPFKRQANKKYINTSLKGVYFTIHSTAFDLVKMGITNVFGDPRLSKDNGPKIIALTPYSVILLLSEESPLTPHDASRYIKEDLQDADSEICLMNTVQVNYGDSWGEIRL